MQEAFHSLCTVSKWVYIRLVSIYGQWKEENTDLNLVILFSLVTWWLNSFIQDNWGLVSAPTYHLVLMWSELFLLMISSDILLLKLLLGPQLYFLLVQCLFTKCPHSWSLNLSQPLPTSTHWLFDTCNEFGPKKDFDKKITQCPLTSFFGRFLQWACSVVMMIAQLVQGPKYGTSVKLTTGGWIWDRANSIYRGRQWDVVESHRKG